MNREEILNIASIKAKSEWIKHCGYTLKNGDVKCIF